MRRRMRILLYVTLLFAMLHNIAFGSYKKRQGCWSCYLGIGPGLATWEQTSPAPPIPDLIFEPSHEKDFSHALFLSSEIGYSPTNQLFIALSSTGTVFAALTLSRIHTFSIGPSVTYFYNPLRFYMGGGFGLGYFEILPEDVTLWGFEGEENAPWIGLSYSGQGGFEISEKTNIFIHLSYFKGHGTDPESGLRGRKGVFYICMGIKWRLFHEKD